MDMLKLHLIWVFLNIKHILNAMNTQPKDMLINKVHKQMDVNTKENIQLPI